MKLNRKSREYKALLTTFREHGAQGPYLRRQSGERDTISRAVGKTTRRTIMKRLSAFAAAAFVSTAVQGAAPEGAMNARFDNIMEKFFDAVDDVFSPRKVAASTIALSLLVTPANAGDRCNLIKGEDTLTIFHGYEAAHVLETLDATKREKCFRFFPLVNNMTVEPDHLCIPIDEDNQQSVWLKFPSGAALDISKEYNSDTARWVYDTYWKTCHGLLNARIS